MSQGPDPLAANPWREDEFPPLANWRDTSALNLTGATTPAVVVMGTSFYGLKWAQGKLVTDVAKLSFQMPFSFAGPEGVPKYDFKLICAARKLNNGAEEDATLGLLAGLNWFTPAKLNDPLGRLTTAAPPTIATAAGAAQSLTTGAKALLAASVNAANNAAITGFAVYELDLGARIRAEAKALLAGDYVTLSLGPTATVGTASMVLEVLAPRLRLRRVQGSVQSQSKERDW